MYYDEIQLLHPQVKPIGSRGSGVMSPGGKRPTQLPATFGYEERTSNEALADAFRERLKTIAGFEYVPPPMPMKNSKGAVLYYLYFAAQKPVASRIVRAIFKKYQN